MNQPVQENASIIASGSLDILASTGGIYKAYIAGTNILFGTGLIFLPLLSSFDSTVGTFP